MSDFKPLSLISPEGDTSSQLRLPFIFVSENGPEFGRIFKKDRDALFKPFGDKKAAFEPAFEFDCSEIIEEAEKKAQRIIRDAEKRAEITAQKAYARGFEQGEKAGFESGFAKGIKQAEEIAQRFEEILSGLLDEQKRILREAKHGILELVFAISKRICLTLARIDTNAVKSAIFEAMEYAAEKSRLTVKVNPDDYEKLEMIRPELLKRYSEVKSLEIRSDSTLSQGGCFVSTSCGDIDASLEMRLERIKGAIEEAYADLEGKA